MPDLRRGGGGVRHDWGARVRVRPAWIIAGVAPSVVVRTERRDAPDEDLILMLA